MNIYVGNLSAELSERELQLEFEAFGEVARVVIMSEIRGRSGRSSGYGFVEMASKIAGAAAIAGLNGKRLKSRYVDVVEALPLSDKTRPRRERKDDLAVGSQNREALWLSSVVHLVRRERDGTPEVATAPFRSTRPSSTTGVPEGAR